MIQSGCTVQSIARRLKLSRGYIQNLLPLTQLGPSILRSILTGQLGPTITLTDLLRAAQQLDWSRQNQLLSSH